MATRATVHVLHREMVILVVTDTKLQEVILGTGVLAMRLAMSIVVTIAVERIEVTKLKGS